MKGQLLIIIMFFVVVSILSSCMSSTVINTEPEGADVYINGMLAGQTPVVMADQKLSMSVTYIKLEKDGYLPLETYIERDEKIDIGAAIAGVFLYYPWLWIFEYNPYHNYILIPDDNATQSDFNDYYYHNDNPPTNQENVNNSTQTQPTKSKAQKLRELKALLNDGIITEDEYNTEKQKILDQVDW